MADNEETIELQGTTEELMEVIPQLIAIRQLFRQNNDRGLYTIPVTTFQTSWEFVPQIKLVFYQLRSETINNRAPVTGEIAYRVIGETSETFTEANARVRATRIRDLFTQPTLFEWQKGKERASYSDMTNGYHFQLLVRNETEARKIITQVMAIENKTPDWSRLTIAQSNRVFPEDPGNTVIMRTTYKKPRRRPREDIKFRYAELHLWGRPKPVTLVDTLGKREDPLILVL